MCPSLKVDMENISASFLDSLIPKHLDLEDQKFQAYPHQRWKDAFLDLWCISLIMQFGIGQKYLQIHGEFYFQQQKYNIFCYF